MEQGILELLCAPEIWEKYYSEKEEQNYWRAEEREEWRAFLNLGEYLVLAERIRTEGYCFSVPEKKRINKFGSEKKRIVYSFSNIENKYLKVLAWLLSRYDDCFSENCYSFRKKHGSKRAITRLLRVQNMEKLYCCKLDIKDYFNQIRTEQLLPMLAEIFEKEPALYLFFEAMLTADCAVENGVPVMEKRGAMAGTPVSAFFANVYLSEADWFFEKQGILYARYSDDIIFFAETKEVLMKYRTMLVQMITKRGLCLNEEKSTIYFPGEAWEFLGISYENGKVDLSIASKNKLKGKIRRKARALYRWKCRRNATTEQAVKVMNRVFCRKLFDNPRHDEMTWTRWFFPLLTTDAGLKEIDGYMQEYLRYLENGGFRKKNYRISYEQLKQWGYQSLVHAFYKEKELSETGNKG